MRHVLDDVPVEAVGLVLGQHDDVQVPRVDDVRQGEVDQPVQAPEGHRRLGSVGGEGHQAFALPTCEDDSEDARRCHGSTLGPRRGPSEACGRSRASVSRGEPVVGAGGRGDGSRACRPADPGVPAARLRRGRRPRRGADPRARAHDRRARALLRRPARRARGARATRCPPTSPTRTPRCRRSASTSRWPTRSARSVPTASRPTSCTRTPGTPTSAVTWRACCTGSRTWSRAHSLEPLRPVEGRAARRRLRAVQLGGEDGVRGRGRGHRGERRHARGHPAGLPDGRPGAGQGGPQRHRPRPVAAADQRRGASPRADATVRALGIDPSRPTVVFVGRITRQKGLPYFLRAVELLPPGRPGGALRRRAGHPADHGRGHRAGRASCAPSASGVVWIEQMLPRDELIAVLVARHGLRVPVGLRAARHRQPRGHGRRAAGRRHRHRRHPGGHRRRRHRAARPDRPAAGRHRHAGGPGPRSSRDLGRRRSPTSSATPRGPRSGASRRGGGSRTTSRGRRSPSGRSRSTGRRWPERVRRVSGRDAAAAIARRAIRSTSRSAVERWSACHRLTAAPSSCVASATIARSRAALASTRTRAAVEPVGQAPRGQLEVAQRGDRLGRVGPPARDVEPLTSASVACSSPWRSSRSASCSEPVVRVHGVPPVGDLGDLPGDQVPGLERRTRTARTTGTATRHVLRRCAPGRPRRRRSRPR